MSHHSFSIITCAYNPSPAIFARLLHAVAGIDAQAGRPEFELIIVDNNSSPALSEIDFVRDFVAGHGHLKVIQESKPGLTHARIAGVKAARYDWIVFFDDDNEPAADYLNQAAALIDRYPKCGVWGPGRISVEFVGSVSEFALTHRELFQERSIETTTIDNVRWGQTAYPIGTGMTVRRDILQFYIEQTESGIYTMTDRIGKSLISGGDIQILLTGIKLGWYAGTSPDLKMNHLIKQEKTVYKKMLQLVYMTSTSAVKLFNEVFPDDPHEVSRISNRRVLEVLYTQMRLHLFKSSLQEAGFQTARKMGELNAQVLAGKSLKQPLALKAFEKLIT